ncbi:LOW QUALITY PROTEIN: Ribosomal_L28e domain-containing protein, partial [Cephalotus follicularis]
WFCRIETGIFCRNPYNLTGICNRSSFPPANSRYATIRDNDVFYLYVITIERDLKLGKSKVALRYEKALEIIDKHLIYWPKFLVHKTKQHLTKMTQMRIGTMNLAMKTK